MGTPERIAARLAEYVEAELPSSAPSSTHRMTSRPSGKPASLRRRSCRSWESPLPQRKLLALDARWHEKKGGSYERTSYPKFIARGQ